MQHIRPMPLEAMLSTATGDEGLKDVAISYALPKHYIPSLPESPIVPIDRGAAQVLGHYALQFQWYIGGYIQYHTDPLLAHLPAHISALDGDALRRYP